jgi:hypothetical protein
MKSVSHNWIVLLIVLLIMQISANFADYRLVYQDDHFLMEGLFQVIETDLDQDGASEFVMAGKNYTAHELFLAWFTLGPDHKPVLRWQSPNLFEDRSVIWVAAGKFTGSENQLLAVTETQYYLFQWQNGQMELMRKGTHELKPLNITGGDLDGDGHTELVVAKIGRITAKQYDGVLQVWKLKENGWELVSQSDQTVGNIRSLTAGDLNGDGKAEIVMEEGVRTSPGTLHLFALAENKITERSRLNKPVKGVIYGLTVTSLSGAPRLITATDSGRVNTFAWDSNRNALVAVEKEKRFRWNLIDLAVGAAGSGADAKLLLIAYPQRLLILSE